MTLYIFFCIVNRKVKVKNIVKKKYIRIIFLMFECDEVVGSKMKNYLATV
jgi:hypothetical protein